LHNLELGGVKRASDCAMLVQQSTSIRTDKRSTMRDFKGKNLTDRLQDANRARQALLQKAKEAPKPDDPAVVERRAALQAMAAARQAESQKRVEAKAAKARAKAELEAAELAAQAEVIAKAAREAAERAAAEEAEKRAALDRALKEALAVEAEKKAARDARYAARKARKG